VEFWKYDVAGNAWAEKENIPLIGSTGAKKKVKAGADIAAFGTNLYATKGNKCIELWMYVPGAFLYGEPPRRDGVLAGKAVLTQGISISPNPLASGFATLRYSLPKAGPVSLRVYDVTGRPVLTQTLVTSSSGRTDLDLRNLAAGIYLVKLNSDDFTFSQKLVVQR